MLPGEGRQGWQHFKPAIWPSTRRVCWKAFGSKGGYRIPSRLPHLACVEANQCNVSTRERRCRAPTRRFLRRKMFRSFQLIGCRSGFDPSSPTRSSMPCSLVASTLPTTRRITLWFPPQRARGKRRFWNLPYVLYYESIGKAHIRWCTRHQPRRCVPKGSGVQTHHAITPANRLS